MGSWDETCALSNLPITPGDKIVSLLLVDSPYKSGNRCYHNYAWSVLDPPIFGVYENYGNFSADGGEGLFVEDRINRFLNEDLLDYLSKRVNSGTRLKHFQDWSDNTTLNVYPKYSRPKLREVQVVESIMILRDVWDLFSSRTTPLWDGNKLVEYTLLSMLENIEGTLKQIIHKSERHSTNPYLLRESIKYALDKNILVYLGTTQNSSLILEWIIKAINNPTDKELFTATLSRCKRSIRLAFVEQVMISTRRSWVLTGHRGSQNREWKESSDIFDGLSKIASKSLELERELYD